MILAALPVLFFGLTLLYLSSSGEWRMAFIKGAVVFGLAVTANTELLSLLGALSRPWVEAAWTLECCGAAYGVWRRRAELAEGMRLLSSSQPWRPSLLAVAPVVIIIAATGVTAWVAPPNTWDSMTYHLARVAHWVADGTVAAYPTNVIRQLYVQPWPEYAILQLQALSGTDNFANLVQWFSMAGSVVAASLIAQQLGSPLRGQMLAAIVVVTLPMGILQSSSTQTDLVLAFWLLCSVSLGLVFVTRSTPQAAAWFASSLGLAMLTKGTAYLFAAPLVAVLGFWVLVRLRRGLVRPALLLLLIPLVINSGYYIRNEALFHNPLGATEESADLVNASYTPQALISNVVRDAVLQFGTPSPRLNQLVERAVTKLHTGVLHIGVNDPATTFPGSTFQVNPLSFDEDFAGDPLQALLAIASVLAAINLGLRRGPPVLVVYSLALVVAYLAFAAYLRWQPWHARLELPLLVLSAPLIGAVLPRWSNARVTGALAAALLVAAVPWVIDNQTRPMVGFALPAELNMQPGYLPAGATIFNTPRMDLYFAKRPLLKGPYADAAAQAAQRGCDEIGLWSGPNDWEYPLWVLARQSNDRSRIDSVFVKNESAHASSFASKPCVLVGLLTNQPAAVVVGGVQFTLSWSWDGVNLYLPSSAG